ncbi:MAG: HAD family hydrolase [Rubellimicrobium sp.]|nr:HAD family hydrolase [Rubellimicrobium sp.]
MGERITRRIDGVLFDKDGTLFDFQATWGAWSRCILDEESRGDPVLRERLADALGYDMATSEFRRDSVVIAHTTEIVAQRILPLLEGEHLGPLLGRMDARATNAPQVEAAPLVEILTALRAMGLRLGVATNDTEAPARAHLAAAGVEGLFDFIAGYDSGHGGKPAPGQLLAFADRTGLDPAHCVMVGDSLHDLHAARAAGMVAVGVLTGLADRATLMPEADVVLDSIADLPAWLAG